MMVEGHGGRHDRESSMMNPERQEINQLVKCRMQSLGQPLGDYGKIPLTLKQLFTNNKSAADDYENM